ncbi:CRISPR-associated protein Cas1 [Neisseria flavescens]|nr:CRISPR-associated protein Cas1 [Neisseria flavescens]
MQDEIGTAFSLFKTDEDITGRLKAELTLGIKQNLIKTLHCQIRIERQHFNTLAAIDKMVSSFQASVTAKNAKQPKLLEILPLKEYQYE